MCAAHLNDDPTGLRCDRLDPHTTGHTFTALGGPHSQRHEDDGGES